MAIVVIVIVQWYSIHVLGFRGYLRRFTKPFELPLIGRIFFTPLNIIEEIAKPLSLALRLFGNIFGGLVMVYLLTLGYTPSPDRRDSDGAVTDLGHPARGVETF